MAIMSAPIRGEAVVRAAQESIKQFIIDNHLGSEQFADYREVVSRWNAWATNAPERQHLADFLAFIRHLDALAPL